MAGPLANLKWERFAREYASGESLAAAYAHAGFKGDPRWYRFNASRLSNKPAVRARINGLMEQFAEACAVQVGYVQQQLLPMLRTNPQDLFVDGSDKLKSIADLPRDTAAAIRAIKFDKKTGQVVEIVLADKVAAAATLLRSLPGGERQEHTVSLESIVKQSLASPAEVDSSVLPPTHASKPDMGRIAEATVKWRL